SIGEETERDAGHGEDDQEARLQRAELLVADAEMLAQDRDKGRDDLAVSEVDEIDKRENEKQAHLIRRERDRLHGHARFSPRTAGDLKSLRHETRVRCYPT